MGISIIIPVYNVEQFLPGCLNSVLANDVSDCEILLIDDGSTDGGGTICDDYARAHPELIRVIHQPNGGLGAARNTGIEAAQEEWLLFLDSDDKLEPQTLAVLKHAIRPDVDVVTFQFLHDDGTNPPTPENSGAQPTDKPFCLAQRRQELLALPAAWMRLWRRSLFTDNGITYPARVWYEDIRTTSKLLPLARGIVVLPDHLYAYLNRPGSIMNSAKLSRNREILDAFDDILGWYRERGLFETYAAELEALTVQHVLLAATVRVARQDPKHPLLRQFRDYTQTQFPNWQNNPYNRALPLLKRLTLRLAAHRRYRLIRVLFLLKG